MKSLAAVFALSLFAIPATVRAQDDVPACSDPYVAVMSAGGPLCVNPTYLDGTWNDDPRDCLYGYYQGTCAPPPTEPTVYNTDAYLYQIDEPTPAQVADVEAKRTVWLTKVDRFRAALEQLT